MDGRSGVLAVAGSSSSTSSTTSSSSSSLGSRLSSSGHPFASVGSAVMPATSGDGGRSSGSGSAVGNSRSTGGSSSSSSSSSSGGGGGGSSCVRAGAGREGEGGSEGEQAAARWQAWLCGVRREALLRGAGEEVVRACLDGLTPREEVARRDEGKAEATLTAREYVSR